MWVGDRAVRGVGGKSAQIGSGRVKNGEVGRWHRGERNIWKNSRDAGSLGGKKNRFRACHFQILDFQCVFIRKCFGGSWHFS